ncbi:hypothetical protein CAEBREN_30818 [Caenorhabditis brenneri]|uniref:Uncharacterized protein n=1 Tax=Caenorhabditis brenneri TaxID=135651 RepID=G0PIF7_CAEBE|nr:hypothetical protein CAEBREN_30818 [Caenorhabditis brenneri]
MHVTSYKKRDVQEYMLENEISEEVCPNEESKSLTARSDFNLLLVTSLCFFSSYLEGFIGVKDRKGQRSNAMKLEDESLNSEKMDVLRRENDDDDDLVNMGKMTDEEEEKQLGIRS